MKKWIAMAVVMIVVGLVGIAVTFSREELLAFGTQRVQPEEKTFDAGAFRKLRLESKNVDIKVVKGADDNRIAVRLDGRASKKFADSFRLEAKEQGDTLQIAGAYDDAFSIGFNMVDVELTVELPAKHWEEIRIDSKYGDIDANGLDGRIIHVASSSGDVKGSDHAGEQLEYESGSGSLELSELSGDAIRMNNSSGDIEGSGHRSGNVSYMTRSGDIEIKALKAEAASFSNRSGDIEVDGYETKSLTFEGDSGQVELSDGTGELTGRTGSGDISVRMEELLMPVTLQASSGEITIRTAKEPASAAVSFRTRSGSLDTEWEGLKIASDNDKQLSGTYGAGSVALVAETGSGDLKLGKR